MCYSDLNSHRSPDKPRIDESASHTSRSTRFSNSIKTQFGVALTTALKNNQRAGLRQGTRSELDQPHKELEEFRERLKKLKPCSDSRKAAGRQLLCALAARSSTHARSPHHHRRIRRRQIRFQTSATSFETRDADSRLPHQSGTGPRVPNFLERTTIDQHARVQSQKADSTARPSALHAPCRNRTYNLAIKSRLLCQLS